MSLKTFHIFFIALSIILSIGCAVWAFTNGIEPVFGVSSAVVAVVLIVYGRYFLKKSKGIIT
jgi:membrane protein implicated in regulation of membrane protease activity